MSDNTRMTLEITEDLIARQPAEAQAIIRLLLKRLAELEARLDKSPQNSSQPPSTQHPHARPPREKKKSKRKRGGQPGHRKHERPLIAISIRCVGHRCIVFVILCINGRAGRYE